jgi:hypothetical protein
MRPSRLKDLVGCCCLPEEFDSSARISTYMRSLDAAQNLHFEMGISLSLL